MGTELKETEVTSGLVTLDHKEYGITETKATEIHKMFVPMLDKMVELECESNAIFSQEISEDVCIAAKELRNKYVKIRTGTAKIHKELKDFYLKGGRFVDGWKNAQILASEGVEKKLKSIENHYENMKKEELKSLHNSIPT